MEKSAKIILIVDDVELNRAILCELFHSRYQILEAENGEEALTLVKEHGSDIAVMLLDIVMPVMDGIEVLQVMKREQLIDTIPVILITAESNEETALRGYNMGVSDIVNKPFNPDIVCRRVENIIELYDHKNHLEKKVQEQLSILNQQAQKLKQTNSFVIDALSTVVEFRNCESGSHIKRINMITGFLLEALSSRYPEYYFSPETIDTIASASAMHDIGKIAIPDSVLLKPGKLTPEEFEIMKTHTIRGCEILQSLDYTQDEEYYNYCYDICRHHHERWDGNGYPDHLVGEQISIPAQVVSLADVYEALISERVYKPAYTHEEAIQMIAGGECGIFNPQLLKCFLEISDTVHEAISNAKQPADYMRKPPALRMPVYSSGEESLSDRTLWLLELEREKYHTLAEISGEIIFDYDARSDTMLFSEKYVEVFGGSFRIPNMTQVLSATPRIAAEDKISLFKMLESLSPVNSSCKIEFPLITQNGKQEWFEIYIHALWRTDEKAECVSLIGKLTNIHSIKMEKKRLIRQANTDPLTGLYNRKAIEDMLEGYLKPGTLQNGALAFIDIDNFKSINDTFGHQFGDETLKHVGGQLKQLFRSSDVVARIGGDEFVVFLSNIGSRKVIQEKAAMICNVFCQTLTEGGMSASISGSVGISCYPEDGSSYKELINKADKALYYAKHMGKNQYAFYHPDMEESEGVFDTRIL